jgi:Ca-activated chloride channel family protein
MNRKSIVSSIVLASSLWLSPPGTAGENPSPPGGELKILGPDGEQVGICPLKHTEVEADVVGFVSRVRVRQTFHNPLDKKIEAVYVFPLPQDAAVDEMTMTVGERRIVGQIKPREEAREVYEAAKTAGHVASLLDQERPNIFTQSVANIEPGVQVVIEISYVETLKYEEGVFEFMFPMVVGPRYMPGKPTDKQGTGWSPDTSQVPDASKISPPVAVPGSRTGHDISLTIRIDAGMQLFDLESILHEVTVKTDGPSRATVTLKDKAEIPNRDFILRYRTATAEIGDALLVHTDGRGTFFTLVLQPPQRTLPAQAVPKELIFVIDRSGSMSGFPLDKAKEAMRLAIEGMNPNDTFNLLSFSEEVDRLFDKPVPNTPENRAKALQYLAALDASGGTEMLGAIQEALSGPVTPGHVRIIGFMTDGYVGNDLEIIAAVREYAGTARVFAFGIGDAVNRFLLDGMAHAGRGEVEYVTLKSQAEGAAERFHERIQAPVLTDIAIDWGTLPVTDVHPKHFPDLFSSKPIMIHGRLAGPAKGSITLRGNTAIGRFERQLEVAVPAKPAPHDALASLWARAKVGNLLMQDYAALQRSEFPETLRKEITTLGVEFHLLTQFTSFVAVEEMRVTVGGEPITIAVPVEMPSGVSYEGVFGEATARSMASLGAALASSPSAAPMPAPQAMRRSPAASSGPLHWGGGFFSQAAPPMPEPEDVASQSDPDRTAGDKLAESLRDLATKVAKEGKDGDLTIGKLRVIDYKVDVMISLRDISAETLAELKKLGFTQTGESKTVRLLVGTIDVRQLEALAKVDTVLRVAPLVG